MLRLFVALALMCMGSFAQAQTKDWAQKSRLELLIIFKEKVETHGNMMNGGIGYMVSPEFTAEGHLQIAETFTGSQTDWYIIDLSKASFGTTVQILPDGKENFFLSFDKSITRKQRNDKAKTFDVAFFRKKDKRDTDFKVLIAELNQLMMLMIAQAQQTKGAAPGE